MESHTGLPAPLVTERQHNNNILFTDHQDEMFYTGNNCCYIREEEIVFSFTVQLRTGGTTKATQNVKDTLSGLAILIPRDGILF